MTATLTVECRSRGCPACGVRHDVPVPYAAPGVLAMPRFMCVACNGEMWIVGPAESSGEKHAS